MEVSNTKAHNGNEVLLINNEVFICLVRFSSWSIILEQDFVKKFYIYIYIKI